VSTAAAAAVTSVRVTDRIIEDLSGKWQFINFTAVLDEFAKEAGRIGVSCPACHRNDCEMQRVQKVWRQSLQVKNAWTTMGQWSA
jgi:predicted transcriptional regulator